MAYTRKNLLLRIIDIQAIYKKHSQKWDGDMTDKRVYERIIYPVYKISRATFYAYLDTNALKELKDMEEAEKAQYSLF